MCVCVCVCVKLPSGDLNFDPCLSQPTNTYTCGMIIAPRMCGGLKFKPLLPHCYN